MWARFLSLVLSSVVVPLLKDLAFMLWNMFKVRRLRLEREQALKDKANGK